MDLKGGGHALARVRRAAARRADAVDLLQVAGGAVLGAQLEPGDGLLALLALGRVGGGGRLVELGAGHGAVLRAGRRVEVEEGRRHVGEEVVAREHVVDGAHLGARAASCRGGRRITTAGGGQVELESRLGHQLEHIGERARDAASVEQSGDGAEEDRGGLGV